jgi:hypothetical protein
MINLIIGYSMIWVPNPHLIPEGSCFFFFVDLTRMTPLQVPCQVSGDLKVNQISDDISCTWSGWSVLTTPTDKGLASGCTIPIIIIPYQTLLNIIIPNKTLHVYTLPYTLPYHIGRLEVSGRRSPSGGVVCLPLPPLLWGKGLMDFPSVATGRPYHLPINGDLLLPIT